MFSQSRVFKSETRTYSSSGTGETTTTVTETVETADGETKTVQRTITERSQPFSESFNFFQKNKTASVEQTPTLVTSGKKAQPQAAAAAAAPATTSVPDPEVAAPTATSYGGPSKQTFQEDALKWHNHYRQKHGVQPIKLSPTLCAYAQEWADKIAKTNSFQHRSNNKYGENLYMKGCSNPNYQVTGKEAVESWYSEIKDHTFGVEPKSMGTGHFTQVVWKSSTELGIASAKGSGGRHYVVANYNPAGNFIGQYAANVPAPK